MSKTVKIVLIVVAVAIIACLAYWYYNKKKAAKPQGNKTTTPAAPTKAPLVANAGIAQANTSGGSKNDTVTSNG